MPHTEDRWFDCADGVSQLILHTEDGVLKAMSVALVDTQTISAADLSAALMSCGYTMTQVMTAEPEPEPEPEPEKHARMRPVRERLS